MLIKVVNIENKELKIKIDIRNIKFVNILSRVCYRVIGKNLTLRAGRLNE